MKNNFDALIDDLIEVQRRRSAGTFASMRKAIGSDPVVQLRRVSARPVDLASLHRLTADLQAMRPLAPKATTELRQLRRKQARVQLGDVMRKAMAAFEAGRINAGQVGVIEVRVQQLAAALR